MYLLDTSAIIEVFENTVLGKSIAEYIKDKPFVVCSLTLYELGKKKNPSPKLLYFIRNLKFIAIDDQAATEASGIFRTLRDNRKSINEFDLLIAASALSKNMELVTSDSDFILIRKFSDLK